MPETITIEEARAKLKDLIHRPAPGEEVVITENERPVAKLSGAESKKQRPCKAVSAKGKIWMVPDFDEPLDDFILEIEPFVSATNSFFLWIFE